MAEAPDDIERELKVLEVELRRLEAEYSMGSARHLPCSTASGQNVCLRRS
jgi:hypothetical protein